MQRDRVRRGRLGRVSGSALLAFTGGLAVAIALSPGGVALVSAPPSVTICGAVILIVVALRQSRAIVNLAAIVCGAIGGGQIASAGAPDARDFERTLRAVMFRLTCSTRLIRSMPTRVPCKIARSR